MGQSSPHQGNQEAQSYYIPRKDTTGPLATTFCLCSCAPHSWFFSYLSWSFFSHTLMGFFSTHTYHAPEAVLVTFFLLRTSSFMITVADSSSLSNFQFQLHMPQSLPDFPGCPTIWPQMRQGGQRYLLPPAAPWQSCLLSSCSLSCLRAQGLSSGWCL